MKERLGLSPEQMREIASMNERYHEIMTRLREKMRPLRVDLRSEMLKRDPERERIRTILEKISEVEVEIRFNRISHRLDMEKVLTPEQKRKLQYERRYHRRHQRHDR
jgi:Spy/CpxP family protein refolding chaperone